jgi:hypothetical protein
MYDQMSGETRWVAEGLFTERAFMKLYFWLLLSVLPHVDTKTFSLRKPLAADFTFKWFDSCVGHDMTSKDSSL